MDVLKRRDGDDTIYEVRLLPEQAEQIGHDSEREFAFAVRMTDSEDPSSLRWLAACSLQRALDLEGKD